MQALLLKKDVFPLQMEIKSDYLYIYYQGLRLTRLKHSESNALCTFILHAMISKTPVIGKVSHAESLPTIWVGITFTSGLNQFKLDLFPIHFNADWTIETIANGKRLQTIQHRTRTKVTLRDSTVELLSLKSPEEPEVFDLNNQEQRSLILDLLAIDHPVFREFVQLIKA